MVATVPFAETRTLLKNISWQTFKTMLFEMGGERNSRLAYDNKIVEIMTPLMPHENSNRLIESYILVLCEEFGLEVKSTGSVTLTRDDLEKGGEPDSSYYIQNESLVRNKQNIDLAQDPPPDLVIEVEYSKSKIDKLSLYASMNIPEFWRYNGTVLRIYILLDNQYSEVELSPTFVPVPVKDMTQFLEESRKIGQLAAKRAFRAWVKQQISDSEHNNI
ncbi:Uma2 family endonuclease [Nostocaceae cyanobacterium CENA357]|uniref:Uma2 family endonuclease n=1 Tax=Atlanticothrix silvestris CENA357 TaxID=1725252 RepID=A0A8J7L408_9CYAN|nr:Uma2 family endonuclease [Atlanticothrix silvestris]MBH8551527.1 Uma2 family endonuclease [Atlanticothrix silvestris CENA357]